MRGYFKLWRNFQKRECFSVVSEGWERSILKKEKFFSGSKRKIFFAR